MSDCWLWAGSTKGSGYGGVSLPGRGQAYVHRFVYELVHGPIPIGLEVDHLCGHRLCFNPNHLEAVTHAENRRRARRTVCCRGHRLDSEPERKGHGRKCRKCDAIRAASYRRRRREAAC